MKEVHNIVVEINFKDGESYSKRLFANEIGDTTVLSAVITAAKRCLELAEQREG